jgi:hypothetical protein
MAQGRHFWSVWQLMHEKTDRLSNDADCKAKTSQTIKYADRMLSLHTFLHSRIVDEEVVFVTHDLGAPDHMRTF